MRYFVGVFVVFSAALALSAMIMWNAKIALPDYLEPETVFIQSGAFEYRFVGEFRIDNRMVDAPTEHHFADYDFEVMKYHVTQAEYSACVADHFCLATTGGSSPKLAQVNVSYLDAQKYAAWLSLQTKQVWRLPSDQEWVRFAGDRFHETILGDISNNPDPSQRWIKRYKEQADQRGNSNPKLRAIGAYGANDLGVFDINGNIWEWTTTCFKNGKVSKDGKTLIEFKDYCGVRAAQGKHRAFIIDFVRDAKGGGCAVGVPPDNLGFRLVREV
ncbi:nitrate reductase [Amylibacter ulvae]|uniref:Nitrate reductase n=2 Tax=Paramylibacter ulvae TaxID=1651968 RepID=A0ABQ3CVG4_9RHOB|nr:nitrate reductase [Amylibacter ulvae]